MKKTENNLIFYQMNMRLFKDTKFWMYLPFACVWGLTMSKWVFSADTKEDGQYRMMFSFFNLFGSLLFTVFTFSLIYNLIH